MFWSRDITAQTHTARDSTAALASNSASQPSLPLDQGVPRPPAEVQARHHHSTGHSEDYFSCITYRASLKPPAKHSQKENTARRNAQPEPWASKFRSPFSRLLISCVILYHTMLYEYGWLWLWIWMWICGVVSKWSSSGLTRWTKTKV